MNSLLSTIKQIGLVCFLGLGLWGCQKNKTVAEVFPESQSSLSEDCAGSQLIKHKAIVRFVDGSWEIKEVHDESSFIQGYLEPNLDRIEKVEYDKAWRALIEVENQALLESSLPASPMWGLVSSRFDLAHQSDFKGRDIVVAVIDSKVELNHPLLQNNWVINTAELTGQASQDDDQNGYVDDVYGWNFVEGRPLLIGEPGDSHGTHVAGIVVQAAPEAKILPLTFIRNDGFGTLSAAMEAIRYARQRKVQVINASWGGPACSTMLKNEIAAAVKDGIFFIAASGNEGRDLDLFPQYPAVFQFPLLITVAAMRPSGFLAGFSNTSYRYVHLAAPGDQVWSALPAGQMGFLSGTSMAAPFVSAGIAILRAAAPQASTEQIRRALLSGVERQSYRVMTEGRLNIWNSLNALPR